MLVLSLATLSCSAQPNARGSFKMNCEGCEAIFESPVPFQNLNAVDTLPDFGDPGSRLLVTGIIYEADGKTPARHVVLYIYHTDQYGIYPKKGQEQGWAKRHGYIRGWTRTGADGRYSFYTLRPAAYPREKIPAHIHPLIKENDMQPYFVDEWLFDDDPRCLPRKSVANSPGMAAAAS